jgi:DNA adenine methylase
MPYFGGKQRIAERIVELFPPHSHYVEPFAGGLSVLLAKPPAKVETVNDVDQALVTFWRVLRDQPAELYRVCALTPHARAERILTQDRTVEGLAEVEIARRVWVELTQGRAGTRRRTGWRFYLDGHRESASMATYLTGYLERMPPAAARLAWVQLECRDALEVIADYGQHPHNLLYLDPPYPDRVRATQQYRHEFATTADHERLAEALHDCRAFVVLSGYPSPLYQRLYPGWVCHRFAATTTQGRPGQSRRVEACWTNYQPAHLFAGDVA